MTLAGRTRRKNRITTSLDALEFAVYPAHLSQKSCQTNDKSQIQEHFFYTLAGIMDFKNGIEIEIMTSQALRGKAPAEWGGSEWRGFYRTFKKRRITPYDFAVHVWNGYSFIPPYKNGRRIEANFAMAYHVAFDFDSEGAALDTLMRVPVVDYFSSFAYSTPSNTDEHPKSRVVFVVPDGVDSAAKTRLLYASLAEKLNAAGCVTDPSTKDPLRLYYGSYHCDVRGNWSILAPDVIDSLIGEYKRSRPKRDPMPEYSISGGSVILSDADEQAVKRRIDFELNKVSTAPDGQKHYTLNRTAYLIGGWVGAGYLSEGDALALLESAIGRADGVKNMQAAITTIKTAVRDGRNKPTLIQIRKKRNVSL